MRITEHEISVPRLSEDLVPFTEYRRNLSNCLERIRRTHRPLFITQNGRATTVVMGIAEYEREQDMLARLQAWSDGEALTRDVAASRREFSEGKGIPARKAFDEVRKEVLAKRGAGR